MPGTRRLGLAVGRVARARLVTSSVFLIAGPVASSVLGFAFWLLAARFGVAADIGIAAAAIAAVSLLMALADFGLSTVILHYASADRARAAAYVNASVSLGWLLILAVVAVFLLGVPLWAPALRPVVDDVGFVALFLVFAAVNHLLALQDAAMVSSGRPSYVLWRTLACNVPSVALVIPAQLVVGGPLGLFAAYTIPNVIVGLVLGLVVLPRLIPGYRFVGSFQPRVVAGMAGYGLANHLGNILWGLPGYLLPLLAVNAAGADATGRFYITWAIASLVLTVPRMVTYALFTEASRPGANLRALSLQALLAIAVMVGPAVAVLWIRGDLVLRLFGPEYVNEALLRTLLASAIPLSISSIWFVWLRAQRRLVAIIAFAGFAAASIVVSAALLVGELGIEGIAGGWLMGHVLTATVACLALVRAIGRPSWARARLAQQ